MSSNVGVDSEWLYPIDPNIPMGYDLYDLYDNEEEICQN